jgi:hypothetical protein
MVSLFLLKFLTKVREKFSTWTYCATTQLDS